MKTVLITGANRGIGLEFVKQCLKSQFRVFATYRDAKSADTLIKLLDKEDRLTLIQFDVTNYKALPDLVKQLPAIDILINNAGYFGPKGYGFGNTDEEEWRQVLEINTIAPLKLIEAVYPNLMAGSGRKIACLSSKVGSMKENTSGGGYIYRSSKAALNSVVKSLSNDLSNDDFTVLALHPGWVKTDMGGPNALIDVEESVAGLMSVILDSDIAQSGKFLNFDGNELPW
ncbi:short-chain dehydrogenase [Veronia nyctiphanis]|uniref:Short-chain dehydrogenase n=1 Tax=Veronia nyctiphanis TaxID=1278244 RepID=A0A4Q0YQF4_9GAMM|nr:SDR family oxidoreductase [Veronia nyctiphanis]RXJ73256.1 short-chain dehydrogenase [Veronia nyctiphanis]